MIIKQKQTRFYWTGKAPETEGAIPRNKPEMENVITFLTREAWARNVRALCFFSCEAERSSEVLDFFLAISRCCCSALITNKFNPAIAMFFKKFVGVLHRSLVMDLFTTPGVNRKLDVQVTTKRCPGVRVHKGFHIVFPLF